MVQPIGNSNERIGTADASRIWGLFTLASRHRTGCQMRCATTIPGAGRGLSARPDLTAILCVRYPDGLPAHLCTSPLLHSQSTPKARHSARPPARSAGSDAAKRRHAHSHAQANPRPPHRSENGASKLKYLHSSATIRSKAECCDEGGRPTAPARRSSCLASLARHTPSPRAAIRTRSAHAPGRRACRRVRALCLFPAVSAPHAESAAEACVQRAVHACRAMAAE